MPRPIAALAKQYQRDALRISTIDERQGHGDISYQAVAVSPNDIENAVINLLRFHEAETAMLFCATRDNVRRLHATLVERGFAAVALSGEHSQNERNQAIQALRDGRARICVATDVAARGIDIPSLSLVVHVEVPRDAETLQHRSGRTGRAGRKGTAVLVVPYPRRRRLEEMLRRARIEAEWMPAPGAAQIRERDRERLLEKLLAPVDAEDVLEDDVALADTLMERMEVRDIALALVRSYRSAMPQPEDLIDLSTEEGRKANHRSGFDDVAWFRMDIGRRQNADPRWLLPLLCRRGHITRNEIGAIRIGPSETFFQVPKAMEDRFRAALQRTAREGAEDETGIRIEPSEPPREMARTNRRQGNGPNRPREGFPPRGDGPRPHRKGPPRRREG